MIYVNTIFNMINSSSSSYFLWSWAKRISHFMSSMYQVHSFWIHVNMRDLFYLVPDTSLFLFSLNINPEGTESFLSRVWIYCDKDSTVHKDKTGVLMDKKESSCGGLSCYNPLSLHWREFTRLSSQSSQNFKEKNKLNSVSTSQWDWHSLYKLKKVSLRIV